MGLLYENSDATGKGAEIAADQRIFSSLQPAGGLLPLLRHSLRQTMRMVGGVADSVRGNREGGIVLAEYVVVACHRTC